MTGFIRAIRATQRTVGPFPEPFRVAGIDDLPPDQDQNGQPEKRPAEKMPDKNHGCKHHEMPPVIDSALEHTPAVFPYQRSHPYQVFLSSFSEGPL